MKCLERIFTAIKLECNILTTLQQKVYLVTGEVYGEEGSCSDVGEESCSEMSPDGHLHWIDESYGIDFGGKNEGSVYSFLFRFPNFGFLSSTFVLPSQTLFSCLFQFPPKVINYLPYQIISKPCQFVYPQPCPNRLILFSQVFLHTTHRTKSHKCTVS